MMYARHVPWGGNLRSGAAEVIPPCRQGRPCLLSIDRRCGKAVRFGFGGTAAGISAFFLAKMKCRYATAVRACPRCAGKSGCFLYGSDRGTGRLRGRVGPVPQGGFVVPFGEETGKTDLRFGGRVRMIFHRCRFGRMPADRRIGRRALSWLRRESRLERRLRKLGDGPSRRRHALRRNARWPPVCRTVTPIPPRRRPFFLRHSSSSAPRPRPCPAACRVRSGPAGPSSDGRNPDFEHADRGGA